VSGPASSEDHAGGAASVLIVEDDSAVREMMVLAIRERIGVACVQAASVPEAKEALGQGPFSAVVLDHFLGALHGDVFFEHLARSDPSLAKRVLFTTGRVHAPEIDALCERTGNLFIKKPFPIVEFIGALETLMARREDRGA